MSSKSAEGFLAEIDNLVSGSKAESTRSNDSVTFNMRINSGLKDDFDKLCRDNHTNMTAEVKRFIRLAVEKQKI
jgi:hypothetical protein